MQPIYNIRKSVATNNPSVSLYFASMADNIISEAYRVYVNSSRTIQDGDGVNPMVLNASSNLLLLKKFAKKGKYTVSIQQAVRETGKVSGMEQLQGISEVGFRIEKAE